MCPRQRSQQQTQRPYHNVALIIYIRTTRLVRCVAAHRKPFRNNKKSSKHPQREHEHKVRPGKIHEKQHQLAFCLEEGIALEEEDEVGCKKKRD